MAQRKQLHVVRSDAELVEVTLHGPKSILPGPMSVPANIHHTWLDLLRTELDIALDPSSSISVCTMDYNPIAPREGEGNTWNLTDKIGDFVHKYGHNKNQIKARLWHPNAMEVYNGANFGANICAASGNVNNLTKPLSGAAVGNVDFLKLSSSRQPSIIIPTRGQAPVSSSGFFKNGNLVAPGPSSPGPSSAINPHRIRRVPTAKKNQEILKKPARKEPQKKGKQQQKRNSTLKRRHEPESEELWVPAAHESGSRVVRNGRKMPRNEDVSSLNRPVTRSVSRANAAVVTAAPQIERVVVKHETMYDFHDESSDVNEGQDNQTEELACNGERGNEDADIDASDNEGDDDLDLASLMTSPEQEQRDLEREGIEVEDVLGPAIVHSRRFSNAFLLRVRHEIQRLKASGEWRRNVYRSPLGCYLIQELIKQQN